MSKLFQDIRARVEAATEGPWVQVDAGVRTTNPSRRDPNWKDWICNCQVIPLEHTLHTDNARFIAASRTDIPKLLEAIDVMQEALEKYKGLARDAGYTEQSVRNATLSLLAAEALARVKELEK